MRRADRLFQIVLVLSRRRLTTAAQLADKLEVSERTIYRDVADLVGAGVPVEGEAGVGYRLGKGFDLPPLMFDHEEVQAIVLGARMVEAWGDPNLRRAALRALDKIEAVLPPSRRGVLQATALFAVRRQKVPESVRQHLGRLREAVDAQRKVLLAYVDRDGKATERSVRPLALHFWGETWTLGGWCELREDHRNFRLDRIEGTPALTQDTFELISPVTLDDYLEAVRGP